MKTVEKIDQEIIELQTELNNCGSREVKRLTEKMAALKQCRFYLKTNPREKFLKEQIGTIKAKLMSIEERYRLWYQCKGSRCRNPRAAFNTEMNVKTLNSQLATLEYLLAT